MAFKLFSVKQEKIIKMKTLAYISILTLLAGQLLASNPTASNVVASGTGHVGATLTGFYDFNDIDGDNESGTTYQWYKSDDVLGTNKTAISGATSTQFTLTSSEYGKYITFEVTPRDDNSEVGISSASEYTGGINDFADLTYNNNSVHNVSGREDYGYLTANNRLTINIGNSDTLIIWLAFDVWNGLTININPGGFLGVKGDFNANSRATIDIDGDMQVSGDLTVFRNAAFTVASGSSLIIGGDLTTQNIADINIEGSVSIDGNLDVGRNVTIDIDMDGNGSGELTVGGDLIGDIGTTINGDGPVSVGGGVFGNITDPGSSQIGTLPIELVSFNATRDDDIVYLTWLTATEINNDYFTIERSDDGVDFFKIGTLAGAGNSNEMLSYNFIDNSPLESTAYYRVKQTDFDGQFSYTNITSVSGSNGNTFLEASLNVFPNPIKSDDGFINVHLTGLNDIYSATLKVLNLNGFEVISEELDIQGQTVSKSFQIDNLIKGTYIIIIVTESQVFQNKVILI